jgi:hypothetical protein
MKNIIINSEKKNQGSKKTKREYVKGVRKAVYI